MKFEQITEEQARAMGGRSRREPVRSREVAALLTAAMQGPVFISADDTGATDRAFRKMIYNAAAYRGLRALITKTPTGYIVRAAKR